MSYLPTLRGTSQDPLEGNETGGATRVKVEHGAGPTPFQRIKRPQNQASASPLQRRSRPLGLTFFSCTHPASRRAASLRKGTWPRAHAPGSRTAALTRAELGLPREIPEATLGETEGRRRGAKAGEGSQCHESNSRESERKGSSQGRATTGRDHLAEMNAVPHALPGEGTDENAPLLGCCSSTLGFSRINLLKFSPSNPKHNSARTCYKYSGNLKPNFLQTTLRKKNVPRTLAMETCDARAEANS